MIAVKSYAKQGTIIRTRVHVRKLFYKSLMNAACLWSRAQFAINKKQKYFLLPDHQHSENLILVFGFFKRKNKDKREFVTKYAEITCTIILMKKMSLILLVKPLLRSVFTLIAWLSNRLIKWLVELSQQILVNYVHISLTVFQLLLLIFEAFKIFWFMW